MLNLKNVNIFIFFLKKCGGGWTRTHRPLGYEPSETTTALLRYIFNVY